MHHVLQNIYKAFLSVSSSRRKLRTIFLAADEMDTRFRRDDGFLLTTAFILVFLLLAMPCPTWAQDNGDSSLYEVRDVAVDVTADNASHARDQAILQAQHSAFEQLLSRLGADSALATKVNDDAIAALVSGFEVQQERRSAVHYIGTFAVQFRPNAIRAFLNKNGSTYSDVRSPPVVVLPVVNRMGHDVLWEDRTPWRAAWESAAHDVTLVPIVVPAGDLDDIAVLSTAEAVSGKPDSMAALIKKYNASGAVVAVLNSDNIAPDMKKPMAIDVFRYDASGKASEPEHLTLESSLPLTDAIKQVRHDIEKGWKDSNKPVKGPAVHLPVTVPIQTLADWTMIKNKLAKVPNISRITIIALGRGAAHIELEFRGEIPPLQDALLQQQLVLEQIGSNGEWQVRNVGTP